MIAIVAAAHAGPELHVLLSPAVLQTPRIVAHHTELDLMGQPVDEARLPDRTPFQGQGLGLALLYGIPSGLAFVEATVRFTTPLYELPGFTFAPVTSSIRVDGGGLGWFDTFGSPPRVDGYGLAGGGLQLSVLAAPPFTTAVAPALHGTAGLGIANRTGATRLRAEVRADLALRLDHLEGRAEQPVGAFTWSWFPGEAALSLVLGVGLPSREG